MAFSRFRSCCIVLSVVSVMAGLTAPAAADMALEAWASRGFSYFDVDLPSESDFGTSTVQAEINRFGNQPVVINSGWNVVSKAYADLPSGVIKTSAYAMAASDAALTEEIKQSSSTHAWISSTGRVVVKDELTFAQPTEVTIRGHVDGYFAGRKSHDEVWLTPSMGVSFAIQNPDPDFSEGGDEDLWVPLTFSRDWRKSVSASGDGSVQLPGQRLVPDVDEPFETTALIPAGTMDFHASFSSHISSWLWPDGITGDMWGEGYSDFSNTLTFEILVPEGAQVTSGLGTLPIHVVPEPASLSLLGLGSLMLWRRRAAV